MQRFILKTILFLVPILIYIGVGEVLMKLIGETVTVEEVAEIQTNSSEQLYFARGLFENHISLYRLEMLRLKKPEVITLGKSIVLQFRDFMFHPHEDKFYNTGQLIRNPYDIRDFVDLLEQREINRPKVIIFGLDASLLKVKNPLDLFRNVSNPEEDEVLKLKNHFRAIQTLFTEHLDSSLYEAISMRKGYGLRGARGIGFRNDGSKYYKIEIADFKKNGKYRDRDRLKKKLGNNRYPFNRPIDLDTIKANVLMEQLDRIKAMGIELLVYFPPISDDLLDHALQDEQFYAYWGKYLSFQESIRQREIPMIAQKRLIELGFTDQNMVDANHPSEVIVGSQLYHYFRSENMQVDYFHQIDTAYLGQILRSDEIMEISLEKE